MDARPENLEGKPPNDELKKAIKAFKKRLKVTQLDAQGQWNRRPATSGKQMAIVAITPPSQFPQAVWDELVRQGKLKRAGQGMYELLGD